MKSTKPYRMTGISLLLLGFFMITGCTSLFGNKVIQNNDHVLVHYTCFSNGKVVATTTGTITDKKETPKSPVFVPAKRFGPVSMNVGSEKACVEGQPKNDLKRFETVIETQIEKTLAGLKYNEKQQIMITADERKDMGRSERYISLARVTKAPKEVRMAREQFRAYAKEAPVVDMEVNLYQGLTGKVMKVTENEVMVRFSPASSEPVSGPFGDVVVHDRGRNYEIEIKAEQGALVRTGPLVGVIIDVKDRLFTLDYGRPFGGRTLACDIEVEEP